MHDVIDLVCFQAEYLSQTPTDLIQEDHPLEGILARILFLRMASSNDYWVEVVVPEFTCVVPLAIGVVSEYCAV
jgi:hypothetical protein